MSGPFDGSAQLKCYHLKQSVRLKLLGAERFKDISFSCKLPVCKLKFNKRIVQEFTELHCSVGRLYFVVVVLIGITASADMMMDSITNSSTIYFHAGSINKSNFLMN